MATLLSITNTAPSGNSIGNNAGIYYRHAQSFLSGNSWTITGADIWALRGAGTNNVPLLVRIETDSSNKPSGTLAHANATASIPSFTDATHVQKTVSFTSFLLSNSTKYWLVLKTGESEASGQYYRSKYDGTTNSYTDGTNSVATGGVWAAEGIYDLQLNILGISPAGEFFLMF